MIRLIREFAYGRKDIGSRLEKNNDVLFDHLAKVYYMRNHRSFDHWISEIYNFYSWIPTSKSNNKNPKPKFIYDHIFGNAEDVFNRIFKSVLTLMNDEYKVKIDTSTKDDFHKFISNYVKWLSEELSINGETQRSSVEDKIIKLLGDE